MHRDRAEMSMWQKTEPEANSHDVISRTSETFIVLCDIWTKCGTELTKHTAIVAERLKFIYHENPRWRRPPYRTSKTSSVGKISEWEGGLRSRRRRRRGGWGVGRGLCHLPRKILHFLHQNHTFLMHSDSLTPFWSNFITGWKWTTMHKMVHFAMLQPNIAHGSRSRRILPC